MHYKTIVFTKTIVDEEELETILKPFDELEEHDVEPPFTFDWWQIGGRYCGGVLAEVSTIDEQNNGIYIKNINGVEILSMLFDRMENKGCLGCETNWYGYLLENRALKCDGAYVNKIKNKNAFDCFAFIGLDGTSRARKSWDGSEYIDDKEFDYWLDKEIKKAKEQNAFMTVIDIHN